MPLGHISVKSGDYLEALSLCQKALDTREQEGKKYGAYACKGTALFYLSDSDEKKNRVRESFERALSIRSVDSPEVRYNLGSTYAALFGDYGQAVKQYNFIKEGADSYEATLRSKGFAYVLYYQLGKDSAHINNALTAFNQALEHRNEHIHEGESENHYLYLTWLGLGISQSLLENYDEATRAFEEALKLNSNNPLILSYLNAARDKQQISTIESDLRGLNVFAVYTVHDYDQDIILKHDHE